jgi:hypothetical protein
MPSLLAALRVTDQGATVGDHSENNNQGIALYNSRRSCRSQFFRFSLKVKLRLEKHYLHYKFAFPKSNGHSSHLTVPLATELALHSAWRYF